MGQDSSLTSNDYMALAGVILVIFALLMLVGNFGNLFKPVSPETVMINNLYRFIYISGSAVGAIFLGALIFLSIRFREKKQG
ncbi:MAG TPA: hypothetical protein EYH45_01805 [Candidatus Caldiarchaeum subterraneum]|uniref:Respiratory chain protein (SoxI-like) n=1 Tax=Caldiarchaeum subterraneum TaxID=311458 RepID=A0A833EA11_CALS0|nr:hypothetical protein [Aigarchaeota archaeon]HIQ29280.1 hypothetical protein [Candidatus Caldarchaeum subterraneum]